MAEGHVESATRRVPENCGDGIVILIENGGNMRIVLERDDLTTLALALEVVKCGARENGIRHGLCQVPMLYPCRKEIHRLGRLRRCADRRPGACAFADGHGKRDRPWPEDVTDTAVPERLYASIKRPVSWRIDRVVVNKDGARMPSLVQNGIDGRAGLRREVGDHDILGVVVEEKPGLLPAERLGERVEISHGRGTDCAVRYAANERLEPGPLGVITVEGRGTIVHRGTWNKIPIPRRGDVLVLVAL